MNANTCASPSTLPLTKVGQTDGCVVGIATAPGSSTFVEYLNTIDFPGSPGGHFFYSADTTEQNNVDAGAAGHFARTGRMFITDGFNSLCRFFGSIAPGPNSHFYTADDDECSALKQAAVKPPPVAVQQWNFESNNDLVTPASVSVADARTCPTGMVPVYRAYNNAFSANGTRNGWDSNHRLSRNTADIDDLVAIGWRNEGIVFCAIK